MTTTTPDSRARIAYTAYGSKLDFTDSAGDPIVVFDDLPALERSAWTEAARAIWDLATTGQAVIERE